MSVPDSTDRKRQAVLMVAVYATIELREFYPKGSDKAAPEAKRPTVARARST